MPKVSVVMPVYNTKEEYLREAIESILNQTYTDYEFIIINDGSTNNVESVILSYNDERIKYIKQENQGLSCARNKALDIAQGEYIQFVDADDYIIANALEKIYNKCSQNNLDMLSFSGYEFDNDTKKAFISDYHNFTYLDSNWDKDVFSFQDAKSFMIRMAVSSCLTVYKKSFIDSIKLYFPEHCFYEDNLFFLKALTNATRISILREQLYYRRLLNTSITHNVLKHINDYMKISDLVLEYLIKIQIDDNIFDDYKYTYCGNALKFYNALSHEYRKQHSKSIKNLCKKYDFKNTTLVQKLFSIRNTFDKSYKIITIFGIEIRVEYHLLKGGKNA